MNDRDDELETRLRRALRDETERVHPTGDGLSRIRADIDAQRRRAWWRRPVLAIAGAAVLGLAAGAVAVTVFGNGDGASQIASTPNPAASTPASEPSTLGQPSPTETPSTPPSILTSPRPTTTEPSTATSRPPAVKTAVVPVYFVGGDPSNFRLYREFHRADVSQGKGRAALTQMFQAPRDDDYASAWPSGTKVVSYQLDGPVARVEVSSEPTDDLGLQQLVYTVTAAEQRADLTVQLSVAGTSKGQSLNRAPALDVQAPVWILAPAQGQEIGSPVTIRVLGNTFEGNVVLKIFRGTQEVTSTFVTTAMGHFQEAKTTVPLPAGKYTLRAYDERGEQMELVEQDSKDFSVS
jgi:hypothetical protein